MNYSSSDVETYKHLKWYKPWNFEKYQILQRQELDYWERAYGNVDG